MVKMGRAASAALVLMAMCATAASSAPAAWAGTRSDDPRYGLVHGCYALQAPGGRFVERRPAGGYAATASRRAGAEVFRMQATALGRYLLYGRDRDFLGTTG